MILEYTLRNRIRLPDTLFSLESLVGFIGNYNALPHTQLTAKLF